MDQNTQTTKNQPPPETWVVDTANGLSELETRLNHLESEGFPVRRIFLLRGLQPEFVILARRLDQKLVEAEPGEPRPSLQENEEAHHA